MEEGTDQYGRLKGEELGKWASGDQAFKVFAYLRCSAVLNDKKNHPCVLGKALFPLFHIY